MGKTTNVTVPLRTRGERLVVRHNPDGVAESRHVVVRIEHIDRFENTLGRLELTTHACDWLRMVLNALEAKDSGL